MPHSNERKAHINTRNSNAHEPQTKNVQKNAFLAELRSNQMLKNMKNLKTCEEARDLDVRSDANKEKSTTNVGEANSILNNCEFLEERNR